MTSVPAKVLEKGDLLRLLKHVKKQRYPTRNTALVLLSFKAGLRACEIAGLDWSMVLSSENKVSERLYVTANIARKGSKRTIPLNAVLRSALDKLHKEQGLPSSGAIINSERGGHMSAGSIVNYFGMTYGELGLSGCSSHSGRRTFITNAARAIALTGGSLRDVQELAGHRALTITERYIEGNRDAQRKLISLI